MTDFPPVLPYPVVSTSAWVTGFSYIVYIENIGGTDYYMAKNGLTGEIDYGGPSNYGGASGIDPAAVINAAITAINALGGGIVDVKEGTYVLPTSVALLDNVALVGTGVATYFNAGIAAHAISVTGDNCLVRDLQVRTTPGGGTAFDGVIVSGDHCSVINVFVNGADRYGIACSPSAAETNTTIQNCYVFDADADGIFIDMNYCQIFNCHIEQSGVFNIQLSTNADGTVVTGNTLETSGDDGITIHANAETCVVTGNSIIGWTNEPVDDDSDTSIVADNNGGGAVLTSKGCSFLTIALAVIFVGASGWIEVPSGTWDERVTITNNNVTLRGQGWDTIINQTVDDGSAITITGDNCVVMDLQCGTTPAGGNAYDGVVMSGPDCKAIRVFVNGADQHGISINGGTATIESCYVFDPDNTGLNCLVQVIVANNKIEQTGDFGMNLVGGADDSVVTGNYFLTMGNDGITINAACENVVVTGNRINGWTGVPIADNSATSTIADNNGGGPVMTSKGVSMATIALAVTFLAGNGWIEVPEGTWDERVTLSDANTILRGQGWGTIIHQTTENGHAITVTGNSCQVRDIQCFTTQAGGNIYDALNITGNWARITNVRIPSSDQFGIYCTVTASHVVITGCYVLNVDADSIALVGPFSTITSCDMEGAGRYAVNLTATSDWAIVEGNVINTTGDSGVIIDTVAENCVVTNNMITGWGTEPVDDNSGTSTVANNNAGGNVMTSKGCSMATIALAETHLAGNGWIEVPEGTWSEAVVLSDANTVLRGQGKGSIIDGGTTGHAVSVVNTHCTVKDITVKTDVGATNAYDGINIGAADCFIHNVFVNGSDRYGIYLNAARARITDCYLFDADQQNIYMDDSGDDSIVSGNILNTSGDDGIFINTNCETCIVNSNRIIAYTNEAVDDDSGTSDVAHNVFV